MPILGVKSWVGRTVMLLVVLGVFLGGVVAVFRYSQNKEVDIVMRNKDTRLEGYKQAQSLALSSFKSFTARTEEEYRQVASQVKESWSSGVWDDYFGVIDFGGGVRDQQYTQSGVVVEQISPEEYTVKITGVMVTPTYEYPLVVWYTIKNGLVIRVESLV